MANAQQTLAGGLHGQTGSFYVTDLDAESRRQVHALSSAAVSQELVSGVMTAARTALGEGSVQAFGLRFRWDAENTACTGQNQSKGSDILGNPLDPTLRNSSGSNAADLLARLESLHDGSDGITRFAIRLPDGIIPHTIDSSLGRLCAGVDFDSYPGMLVTRVNPADAFPEGWVFVGDAEKVSGVPGSYPASSLVAGPADMQMRYARGRQTLLSFRAAAAEAIGLTVVRRTDLLLDKFTTASRTVYVWASGSYDIVTYAHSPLTVGMKIQEGTVVSDRPGFDIVEATTAQDLERYDWDFSFVSESIGVLSPVDAGYNDAVGAVINAYGGRLLVVKPGAYVLGDSTLYSKLLTFMRRSRPIGTVFIIQAQP